MQLNFSSTYIVCVCMCVCVCVCVCVYVCAHAHSIMSDSFVTPWTIATSHLCPWDFPGKNTRAGCQFLLQGIFLTQGSNTHSCVSCIGRWILYHQPSTHIKRKYKQTGKMNMFYLTQHTHFNIIDIKITNEVFYTHSFCFYCVTQLARCQFPDWGLNLGSGSESAKYESLGHQGIPYIPFFFFSGDFPHPRLPCRCKEDDVKLDTEMRLIYLQANCHQGLLPQPEGRTEQGMILPQSLLWENNPANILISDFQPKNCERIHFCCFNPLELAVICYNSPRKVLQILVIQFGLALFQVCNSHM